jgi:hypothetical protein
VYHIYVLPYAGVKVVARQGPVDNARDDDGRQRDAKCDFHGELGRGSERRGRHEWSSKVICNHCDDSVERNCDNLVEVQRLFEVPWFAKFMLEGEEANVAGLGLLALSEGTMGFGDELYERTMTRTEPRLFSKGPSRFTASM